MSKYAEKQFWVDAGDRAVSTFAQATVGAILASSAVSIIDLNLGQSAAVGGLAALISVLQSIAARGSDGPVAVVGVTVLEPVEDDAEFDNPDSPQFDKEVQ